MKTLHPLSLVLFFAITALVLNSSSLKALPDTLLTEAGINNKDTLSFELLIFDPGFEPWFRAVSKPETHYSKQYLESWNIRLVNQWNALINRPLSSACSPQSYIHYDMANDYGISLNHTLFYYFRFMQEKCRLFHSYPARWR